MRTFLIIFTLMILSLVYADEWSFTPSLTVGVGANPLGEDNRVYGLVQGYILHYGGEEGGLRFLGIGTSVSSKPTLIITPAMTCVMDKVCVGPHFGKDIIGLGFSYSFGP